MTMLDYFSSAALPIAKCHVSVTHLTFLVHTACTTKRKRWPRHTASLLSHNPRVARLRAQQQPTPIRLRHTYWYAGINHLVWGKGVFGSGGYDDNVQTVLQMPTWHIRILQLLERRKDLERPCGITARTSQPGPIRIRTPEGVWGIRCKPKMAGEVLIIRW